MPRIALIWALACPKAHRPRGETLAGGQAESHNGVTLVIAKGKVAEPNDVHANDDVKIMLRFNFHCPDIFNYDSIRQHNIHETLIRK
jgi:hypothetical protein